MNFVQEKKHVDISHDMRTTLGETHEHEARLISHEIILLSHLTRNPLDSIVKSYCKTTHIEAAVTSHLFERGICWSKPPQVKTPVGIPHKLYIQLLPTATN